jgi:hypothetical protein
LAQSYLTDDPILQEQEQRDPKSKSLEKRKFIHNVSRRGLAASTIAQVRQVLNRTQLLQCADAYVNNGMVRTLIDKSVLLINPKRTSFVIEPNDELVEGASDQETREINDAIANDTLMVEMEGYQTKPARIKDLRKKIVRVNKRVKLYDRNNKLLNSKFVFGKGALETIRFPTTSEWPRFGEPMALRHLNSIRLVDVSVDIRSGIFKGYYYDEGTGSGFSETKRFIKAENLVPIWHDDNNLYDNTNYSGLSAVWTILSVSQADDVINDEDIPEITKNLSAGVGFVYPGSSAQGDVDEMVEQLNQGTWVVTPKPDFRAEVHDLGRDPMQLPDVREADAKYMAKCLNSPMFMTFEDTANFATANQVMQVYKAGVLEAERTSFQGTLEDYYYATILADHLNIELKDVISAPINIKVLFPDTNFEVRNDIIAADKILVDIGTMNPADVAKDINRADLVERIEQEMAEEEAAIEKQRQQAIKIALAQRNGNSNNNGQPPNNFQGNQQQT